MEGGPPSFPQGFTCPAVLGNTTQGRLDISTTGLSPSLAVVSNTFIYIETRHLGTAAALPSNAPQHQRTNAGRLPVRWFGLFPFRSPLLRESRLLFLPEGTEMVQFPSFATLAYGFSQGYQGITPGGLPHSDIPGSPRAYHSPRLIAVCHVLHRLRVPRHPPYALTCLTLMRNVGLSIMPLSKNHGHNRNRRGREARQKEKTP